MFSEYASRFLAQSQAAHSHSPTPTAADDGRRPSDSRQLQPQPHHPPRRWPWSPTPSSHRRSRTGKPYPSRARQPRSRLNSSSSHVTFNFPFASRAESTYAPLFYSAEDGVREEEEEQQGGVLRAEASDDSVDAAQEEHAREIADFYALQRSRRYLSAQNSRVEGEESVMLADEGAAFAKQLGWNEGERTGRWAVVIDHGRGAL